MLSSRARPPVMVATMLAAAMLTPLGPAAAAPVAGPGNTAPDSAASDSQRQQAFSHAAKQYGVPAPVLLAVSYLESRWDANQGQPSRSAGYGPMHLTDIDSVSSRRSAAGHHTGAEDPRGDDARPMRLNDSGPAAQPPASLRTLRLAATLTGHSRAELRSDPATNIHGGAAVLAHYQRQLGKLSDDPGAWYGSVARYAGAEESTAARQFADEVYATMKTGAARTTDDGHRVELAARPVQPRRQQLAELGLRAADTSSVDCPSTVSCEWIPAPYEAFGDGDYGNHDKADRPNDLKIRYILIHDTETSYESTLRLVQDPTYVSWQYTLRSSDGHIAQHVKHNDVAWHAGNWYVNTHSIGLEHEGFAAQGTWYTEAMYRSSSKLVRYLADRYNVPLDRAHIIGHDNVPAITPDRVPAMHWDT
ncbi:MAG: N-acetylmuramoyl-L-alanine amidase, partial [Micromonosporaceae bacterium]